MHDQPTPPEMLDAVAAYLRAEVLPALDGATAFGLRVAIGAVELARRELLAGGAEAERARLAALLGRDGPVDELTAELADALRAGELSLDTPGVLAHLWATTEEKLAVDQPGYAGLARARRLRGGS